MEEYRRLKQEHFKLYSQYHRWYYHSHQKPTLDNYTRICRTLGTKYTSFKRASGKNGQKQALYKELRLARHRRTLAWRRYRQRVRFNVFRLVFFKQTQRCPEFCRQFVEQYL